MRSRGQASVFLGVIFFGFGWQVLDLLLITTEWSVSVPYLLFWGAPFSVAFGPLLLLFTKSYLKGSPQIQFRQIYHFLPYLVWICYILYCYQLQPRAEKIEILQNLEFGLSESAQISPYVLIGVLVHYFGYLVYSSVYVRKKTKAMPGGKKHDLYLWVGSVQVGLFFIWMVWLFKFLNLTDPHILVILFSVLTIVYAAGIIFWGFRRPYSYDQIPGKNQEKYAYSNLTESEEGIILDKLNEVMESEKLYRDDSLTLSKLSRRLGIPEKHLSQVINKRTDQNFNDFINTFRIQEVKEKLSNPKYDHLTITSLAFDSGFNSKSSFYTAFKKITWTTPGEYRKSMQ